MKRLFQSISVVTFLALTVGCSTKPALHVIGVYTGQAPPGIDDRPWWAKCDANKGDIQPTASPSPIECPEKYAGIDAEKEVTVSVSDDSRPIVLALTAYDKTHWKVALKEGVKIRKVILGGYHSQRVSGIPTEIPVETYTHDRSPCERCWQGGKYFYSYEKPPHELKEIAGLEIASFQGRYASGDFSIFPGMKWVEQLPN